MTAGSRKKLNLLLLCLLLGACDLSGNESPALGGGSIVAGLAQIGSLDPPRATGDHALTLLRTACDGVVGLDAVSGAPRPALAESWTLALGARRFDVVLRPDLAFHDGEPVTAGAVRDALSRPARPAVSSPWMNLVSMIEGFAEVRAGDSTHLSGVRSLDERTLQINLSRPFSDFPTVLSHPSLIPVSPKSLSDNPDGSDLPVCAGPYSIEPGLEEGDLRLTRSSAAAGINEGYLDDGRGLAERILVRAYEGVEDAYQAYRTGQVDIAPVPDSRLSEARVEPGYRSGVSPRITYLAFDPANQATASPQLRQAISLAIDRLAVIEAAYGDRRRPATRWLPAGYGPDLVSTCTEHARRIADPGGASALLAESEVDPSAVSLSLYFDSGTATRFVAEALQVQVRENLGVTLDPRPLEGTGVLQAFEERTDEPAAWIMATDIELPLPDQYLGDVFRSDSEKNRLFYSDPEFDALISDARSAIDPSAQRQAYVDAENVLCARMPAIPLWNSVSHWMINPDAVRVEGERTFNSLGGPLLRHMQVAS